MLHDETESSESPSTDEALTDNVLLIHINTLTNLSNIVDEHLQQIRKQLMLTLEVKDTSNAILRNRNDFFTRLFVLFDSNETMDKFGERLGNFTSSHDLFKTDEFTRYIAGDLCFGFIVIKISISELIKIISTAYSQFLETSNTTCKKEQDDFHSIKTNIGNNLMKLSMSELDQKDDQLNIAFNNLIDKTKQLTEKLKQTVNVDIIRELIDQLTITEIESKINKINKIINDEKFNNKTIAIAIPNHHVRVKQFNSMASNAASGLYNMVATTIAPLVGESDADKRLSDLGTVIVDTFMKLNNELSKYRNFTNELIDEVSKKNGDQLSRCVITRDLPITYSHEFQQITTNIKDRKKVLFARAKIEEEKREKTAESKAVLNTDEEESSNQITRLPYSDFKPVSRDSRRYSLISPPIKEPRYCAGNVFCTLGTMGIGGSLITVSSFSTFIILVKYCDMYLALGAAILWGLALLCITGKLGSYTGQFIDEYRAENAKQNGSKSRDNCYQAIEPIELEAVSPDGDIEEGKIQDSNSEESGEKEFLSTKDRKRYYDGDNSNIFYSSRPSSDTINLQKLEEAKLEAERKGTGSKKNRCAAM